MITALVIRLSEVQGLCRFRSGSEVEHGPLFCSLSGALLDYWSRLNSVNGLRVVLGAQIKILWDQRDDPSSAVQLRDGISSNGYSNPALRCM